MQAGLCPTVRARCALVRRPIGARRLATLGLLQLRCWSGRRAAKGWDAAEAAKRQALRLHPIAQDLPQAGDQRRSMLHHQPLQYAEPPTLCTSAGDSWTSRATAMLEPGPGPRLLRVHGVQSTT